MASAVVRLEKPRSAAQRSQLDSCIECWCHYCTSHHESTLEHMVSMVWAAAVGGEEQEGLAAVVALERAPVAQAAACIRASATSSIAQHGCCLALCSSRLDENMYPETARSRRTSRQCRSAAQVRAVTPPVVHL